MVQPLKRRKGQIGIEGPEPRPVIADDNTDATRTVPRHVNTHHTALAAIAQRVLDDLRQSIIQQRRVGQNPCIGRTRCHRDLAILGLGAVALQHARHRLRHANRRQVHRCPPRRHIRKMHRLFHCAQQRLPRLGDMGRIFRLLGIPAHLRLVTDQTGHTDHRMQGCSHLVADPRKKRRLGAARLLGFAPRFLQTDGIDLGGIGIIKQLQDHDAES